MKASITLTIGLLFFSGAHSQADTLSITGNKSSLALTNNAKVRVKTADRILKGYLHILNDSTIRVADTTIQLNQITCITTRRKYNRKVTGTILTGVGAAGDVGTVAGAIVISKKSYEGFLGGLAAFTDQIILITIGAGSAIMTTVGIILLCRNRNYQSTEYAYSIH